MLKLPLEIVLRCMFGREQRAERVAVAAAQRGAAVIRPNCPAGKTAVRGCLRDRRPVTAARA